MIGETRLKAALLGSGAAIALLASPAVADEVTDLKAQIDALQNRLDQLEVQQTKIASEQVAPAQAITAGEFPGSIKLGETSLALSGYVKLDAIYTMGAPGDPAVGGIGDSFVLSNIPADGSFNDNRDDDIRLHARQSRFRIDSRTPTEWGSLRTRIEGDFFGGGGNQNFSNSNGFRLRHAWGSLGPVLFGQTWSTFMDQDAFFDTIDFAGATGAEFVRQAQIRYTADMGNGLSADVAVENPEFRDITTTGAATANNIDKVPDLVGALRYRQDWGAVNFTVLGRHLTYDNGLGQEDSTWGYGLHGGVTVNVFGKDSISGVFNWGDGMGRYFAGNGGLINEAVVTCSTPQFVSSTGGNPSPTGTSHLAFFAPGCGADLHTQTSWGGWGGYAHTWTDTLRSNIIYGYSRAEWDTSLLRGAAFGRIEEWQSLHVNLMWSPVPKVTFGIEYMQGWIDTVDLNRTFAVGTDDDANKARVQLGMQVNFP